MTQLQDTRQYPGMVRINALLADLKTEIDALPLRSHQDHTPTQSAFFSFRASFNTIDEFLVKEGPAVVLDGAGYAHNVEVKKW